MIQTKCYTAISATLAFIWLVTVCRKSQRKIFIIAIAVNFWKRIMLKKCNVNYVLRPAFQSKI